MSEGRGQWGAREDASWWAGGEQLQQQALLAQQEDAARSAASAAHQLFSYKMAASPPAAYDYRLGMGGLRAAPGDPPHWWYSAGVDPLHQSHQLQLATSSPSPTHQQQSQQNQHSSQQNSQQTVTQQSQQSQQQQQQQALQTQQQVLQQQLQSAQQQLQSQQQQHLQQSQQQLLQQSQQQQQQQHLQQSQQQQLQQQQQQLQQQHLQLSQGQVLQSQVVHKGRMPRGKSDMKPRGRMTAYAFFVQTCREEHKKKHPDENVIFAAFSKKCAERWKMLDKEKQRFHEMAERDKKRYDLEMQSYVPPKGEKVGRGRKRKQIKDPNAPKRSLSAFFWFCNDERSKVKAINPEYGVGDIAKELGRRWADCDPEMKSKYEALSEKDKARYDREMTAYKKKPKPVIPIPEEEEEEEPDEEEFE